MGDEQSSKMTSKEDVSSIHSDFQNGIKDQAFFKLVII